MAQYKVLQDIEAEDKLLGPLSLRQFIYAAIVVALGFIGFKLLTVKWFLAIPFIPPIMFFGLLAAPFGRDQPSEVWLLAKIRFWLMPRRRVWDQTGYEELVTITVPKKIEQHLTKGFSNEEVTSRLKALAATLDTRGWAIKNVTADMIPQPVGSNQSSDRLVDISALPPAPSQVVSVDPSADILDDTNNPVAQKVGQMIDQSEAARRQALLEKVKSMAQTPTAIPEPTPPIAPLNNYQPTSQLVTPSTPGGSLNQPLQSQSSTQNLPTLQPLAAPTPTAQSANTTQAQAVTTPVDAGILNLVTNNDLNVATISKLANEKAADDGEVVIKLR